MNTIRFCIFLFITWNIANNIISAQPLSDELRFDEHNLYSQNILSNDDINILKAADLMAQGNFLEASSIYQNLYESTREYYFIKQMALAQSQAGNIEKSLEFAKKYQELSKDVDDLETNLIIAEDHIRKGEYNLASILLEKSLQTTPRLQTHYILSNIYMQQKMPDKALEHFIAIYNDEMSMGTKFKLESLNHIITIYLQQEEINKALIYLNEYIANNEYEINIQNFLALYTKLKKVEILKENLQKRFAEVQSIENARMLIGVLIQLKEHNEALKILKQNEFLFEQNGKEMFMQIYADKGDFKQATKIAKELYNQTHQIDFLALSAIYEYEVIDNKNKTTLGPIIKTLQFVIEQRDNELKAQNKKSGKEEAFFYNFLGYILIDYNIDIDKGLEYINMALAIQPNSAEYLDSLAWGFYKKGDCKKAQETFQLILPAQIESLQELQEHNALIQKCKY